MNNKILLMIFIGIFLISFTSAWNLQYNLSDAFSDGKINTTLWYNTTAIFEFTNYINISDIETQVPFYLATQYNFNTSTTWRIDFNLSHSYNVGGDAFIAICNKTQNSTNVRGLDWGNDIAGGKKCPFSTGPGPLGMYYGGSKNLLKTQMYIVINGTNRNVTLYNWDGTKNSTMTYPMNMTNMFIVFGVEDSSYAAGRYINMTLSNFNVYDLSPFDFIHFNNPSNNYISNSNSINFNCSANSEGNLIQNISLYLDGIKNYTINDGLDNFTELSISRNIADGIHNWTCRADNNNSVSIVISNQTLTINTISPITNSITFNTSTYTTSLESFIINISYDITKYYDISAMLVYNNTNYTSTKSNGIFTKTISIPTVVTSTNFSFYWIISLINSSGTFSFNSDTNNQSVNILQDISISVLCGTGYSPAFNFSIFSETNQSSQNALTITYNLQYGLAGNNIALVSAGSLTNTSTFSICINNSYPIYNVGYGEINYHQTGFNARRFYIFSNTRLTNTTITNPLYLLETSSSSQSFTINAKDSGLNPYSNNYISLLKWYPDLNAYKIVEMGKTDGQGNTQTYVRLNDVDYRVGLYSTDGTLIQLDSPTRFTCAALPCVYPLLVRNQQSFTNVFGIQQSLTYSNSTGLSVFTYIWNDPSQSTTLMNLTIWKDTGTDSTSMCSVSSASFTGVLSCSLPVNSTGTFRAEVYRSASPTHPIISLIQSITIEAVLDTFIKLFFGFLIAAIIIFMGVYMGIVPAIFFGIIACVVLVFFGVVEWWMAAGIIVIGIVILNTIKKT